MENSENKLNKNEIEAEPPKIVKHIKWFWLYGKDNKGIVLIFILVILLIFFSSDIKNFILKKDNSLPAKIESADQNQQSIINIPDVSTAKREIFITSIDQLKPRSNIYDVSKSVPGYFEFTASPSSGAYSNSKATTKEIFNPNYYTSIRVVGLEGSAVIDFEGRDVWFGLSTTVNKYYIYESEENWTTWRDLNVQKDGQINTLSIYQKGRNVSVYLNGKFVSSFVKLKMPKPGPISIGFKANPKTGGRIHFQKLSIWEF